MLLEVHKEAHTLVCNGRLGLVKTSPKFGYLLDTCQKVVGYVFKKMFLKKCNTIGLILLLRILL